MACIATDRARCLGVRLSFSTTNNSPDICSSESRNENDRPGFHGSPSLFLSLCSYLTANRDEVCRARSRQMQKIAVVGSRDHTRASRAPASRLEGVKLNSVLFRLLGKAFFGVSHLRARFNVASLRLLIESPTSTELSLLARLQSTLRPSRISLCHVRPPAFT